MYDKQKTCCFSGHRPGGLPFGYDEGHPDCRELKIRLLEEADRMRARGVTVFLTGMAQGIDMIAAELVLDLRLAYPADKIRLAAIVPHEGQADRWTLPYRERYFDILSKADEVITLRRRYTTTCMQERNRYMVNASSYLIAVYNGGGGGTKHTVEYAVKQGLEVIVLNPVTLKRQEMRGGMTLLRE